MKTLTVRVPEPLAAEIHAESRERKMSTSDVVRERLQARRATTRTPASLTAIADLIGTIDALPADVSSRRKDYLTSTRYGRKRSR